MTTTDTATSPGTVVVICGGVGAARFLRGLATVHPPNRTIGIVNVGDDFELHGLAISPDLDTILYTLTDRIDSERGWGVADESWRALSVLREIAAANGRDDGWFQIGDLDLGVHLYRTSRLREGASLSTVTAELCRAFGLDVRLLPVTDDPVRTVLDRDDGQRLSFQEYFVRDQHSVDVSVVSVVGAPDAAPASEVIEAIGTADAIVIAPSNPILSIAPVLAIPGVAAALAARRDNTVAISPIIAGKAVKGPADRLLANLGHEPSVVSVARLMAPFAATLILDSVDAHLAADVEALGMVAIPTATLMSEPEVATALAATAVAAARAGISR